MIFQASSEVDRVLNCNQFSANQLGLFSSNTVEPEVVESSPEQEKTKNPLSLDSYKNNYKYKFPLHQCRNRIGYFEGIKIDQNQKLRMIRGNLPCNSWFCEPCRKIKIRAIKRRVENGSLKNYARKGFRSKYDAKFFTFTCGGKDFRSRHTAIDAYNLMSKAFNSLCTQIAQNYGKFQYLRVQELHKDGYPHFHVVLVGPGISKRSILGFVRHIWTEVNGLGNIDVKVVKNLSHAINYLLKYLYKDPQKIGDNKKLFTSSKGALEMKKKTGNWLATKFTIGDVHKENDLVTVKEVELEGFNQDEIKQIIEDQINKFFSVIKTYDIKNE